MILLEVGDLTGLILLILFIMAGPPIILTVIGFSTKRNNPGTAKVLFILAAVYLIIGLGICGSMMM